MKLRPLLALGGLGAAVLAASRTLSSTPEEGSPKGHLPAPPKGVPRARLSRTYEASPEALRRAAEAALWQGGDLLTGRLVRLTPTERGVQAVFQVGPFRDDLAFAVEPGPGGGAVLHVQSASRLGRSDWGVNALRVRRMLVALETHLPA